MDNIPIEEMPREIDRLLEENERLNNIIDKAVKYIKHYGNLYCLKGEQFKNYYQYNELLEILDKEKE